MNAYILFIEMGFVFGTVNSVYMEYLRLCLLIWLGRLLLLLQLGDVKQLFSFYNLIVKCEAFSPCQYKDTGQ
jgi:hypothetical protein